MIIDPQSGTPMLYHFIEPVHLLTFLRTKSFYLTRLDQQSDLRDGKLPDPCFDRPYMGQIAQGLGLSESLLASQARGIEALRPYSFIMSWTQNLDYFRGKYPNRCTLTTSLESLHKIIGYESIHGHVLPPSRTFPSRPSIKITAVTHKNLEFKDNEQEIRIHAGPSWDDVDPENPITETGIPWEINYLQELRITIAESTNTGLRDEIRRLAEPLSITVSL